MGAEEVFLFVLLGTLRTRDESHIKEAGFEAIVGRRGLQSRRSRHPRQCGKSIGTSSPAFRGYHPSRIREPRFPGEAFEEGKASWYGAPFHGRRASNGEVYDMNRLTAAHRTLPFNTVVRVTNMTNGRSTTVRITDRGPIVDNRIIDLSFATA